MAVVCIKFDLYEAIISRPIGKLKLGVIIEKTGSNRIFVRACAIMSHSTDSQLSDVNFGVHITFRPLYIIVVVVPEHDMNICSIGDKAVNGAILIERLSTVTLSVLERIILDVAGKKPYQSSLRIWLRVYEYGATNVRWLTQFVENKVAFLCASPLQCGAKIIVVTLINIVDITISILTIEVSVGTVSENIDRKDSTTDRC